MAYAEGKAVFKNASTDELYREVSSSYESQTSEFSQEKFIKLFSSVGNSLGILGITRDYGIIGVALAVFAPERYGEHVEGGVESSPYSELNRQTAEYYRNSVINALNNHPLVPVASLENKDAQANRALREETSTSAPVQPGRGDHLAKRLGILVKESQQNLSAEEKAENYYQISLTLKAMAETVDTPGTKIAYYEKAIRHCHNAKIAGYDQDLITVLAEALQTGYKAAQQSLAATKALRQTAEQGGFGGFAKAADAKAQDAKDSQSSLGFTEAELEGELGILAKLASNGQKKELGDELQEILNSEPKLVKVLLERPVKIVGKPENTLYQLAQKGLLNQDIATLIVQFHDLAEEKEKALKKGETNRPA